jgi:hypothetical protein
LRCVWLDADALGWNADVNVIWANILCRDGGGADHTVFADVDTGENGCVVRNADVVVESRHGIGDIFLIDDAVCVAVDVGVIANGNAVAEYETAAVVEENMAVDDDVIADVHVVAERELDVLERFEVFAATVEDVRCEDAAETDAEVDVLAAEWGAVK